MWYWDIYVYGEKKSTTFSKFRPLISTVITVSFSNRKLEDEPHWRPEGPASPHCSGSSPTHPTLCCGVLSVDSNSQGRAIGSLCGERPEGTPGASSPAAGSAGKVLLRTALAKPTSLLGREGTRHRENAGGHQDEQSVIPS